MTVTMEKTIRELALESPAATRGFEKLGIDYCCGGNQSLEQACQAANVSFDQVLNSLETAESATRAAKIDRDWQKEPLSELIAHVSNTNHLAKIVKSGKINMTSAARSAVLAGKSRNRIAGFRSGNR